MNRAAILAGYTKWKKRELFWRGFFMASATETVTDDMINYGTRLLQKKDRAMELFNSLMPNK